jgi:hypothetical protein
MPPRPTPAPLPLPRALMPAAKRPSTAPWAIALPPGRRARARLCFRLAAPLSFLLLLAAFLRTQPPAAPLPAAQPFAGPGKVAFLFLARAGLPLDFLWDAFFRVSNPFRLSPSLRLTRSSSFRSIGSEF